MLLRRQHVYFGAWGSAPFQVLQESTPNLITVLPTMPEWYLVIVALGGISALSLLWWKLIFALPLFVIAAGATVWQAILSAAQARFPSAPSSRFMRNKLFTLTMLLHLGQPFARLLGRARYGLTALRVRVPSAMTLPFPKTAMVWNENWRSPEESLEFITQSIRKQGPVIVSGGDYDRWDFEVRGGLLGAARVLMTVEEHGAKKQLFRFRHWPRFNLEGVAFIIVFAFLAIGAALDQSLWAFDVLALVTLGLIGRMLFEAACAMGVVKSTVKKGFKDQP